MHAGHTGFSWGGDTVAMVCPTKTEGTHTPSARVTKALGVSHQQTSSPVPQPLADQQVEVAHPPPVQNHEPKVGSGDLLSVLRDVWTRCCHNLTPPQHGEQWQVLVEFQDFFAFTEEEVGLTHLVQHDTDTGNARPIKTRYRRHQAAAENCSLPPSSSCRKGGAHQTLDSH